MSAVAPEIPKRIPVNGHPIRLRFLQMILWGGIIGTVGTWVIAALYYLVLEANWGAFWLKQGWDNLFPYTWWDPVRHDVRDVMEGVLATVIVKSLMANWHKKGHARPEVSGLRVAMAPLLLFIVGLPLAFGGGLLLNAVHIPAIPGAATLAAHEPQWLATFLGQYNWQPLLLGLIIGRVIHPLFAPAGATVQDFLADLGIVRWNRTGRIPLWVRHDVAPPPLRERAAWMKETGDTGVAYGRAVKAFLTAGVAVMGLLGLYGGFIKLWLAKHGQDNGGFFS